MQKSLKGTQTEKNLLTAFAGESQARNRYTYFASAAKKEGYEQISRFFTETAENEKEHAKIFFKFLEGGNVEITAAYPAGVIGDTKANLEAAAAGEYEEWAEVYVNFAKVAREEGFDDVASAFTNIAVAEQFHEGRYRALSKNIADQKVFQKGNAVKWHCLNCGYIHEGNGAPDECPACSHLLAYFEILAENY